MGTFLITGATSGIGRAVALQLTENGHRVIGIGRDETRGLLSNQIRTDWPRSSGAISIQRKTSITSLDT